MDNRKLLRAALFATFAGAMFTASPALATHSFQLKNCDTYFNTWDYWIYNANDGIEFQPYMKISFTAVDQVKNGECEGEGEGFCKVLNADLQKYQFHVQSAKTVYGDAGFLRIYDGLLDCSSEPAN